LHVSAALVKLRSLTVARKYLTWCISIAEFYRSISQPALASLSADPANKARKTLPTSSPSPGGQRGMNIAINPANINARPLPAK
jgi:hypothetical protein